MAQPTTMRDRLMEVDRPHLLVIVDGSVSTHALPDAGTLVLGRTVDAEVRIDHPSISRRHARLHLGASLRLEDLGSANGTRVRGRALVSGRPVLIEPGETIELGAAVVIVQAGLRRQRAQRIWAHGYFEARFEDECARVEASGGQLALLRVSCGATRTPGLIEERLTAALREGDVLGLYAPGEYEVLLPDLDPDGAAALARTIVDRLAQVQVTARIGLVSRPRDGRHAHLLFAAACAAVRTPGPAPAARGPVLASEAMRRVYQLVERIAASDVTVLIRGETGVGKELVAEAIHRRSPRARAPMLRLNGAALPDQLVESELFGHERGAFTGAVATRVGLLGSADGGTVFLDEVADLPLAVQAKLLRVLEDRAVTRLGSVKARVIDVRFVAATHKDLEAEVARGAFRADLYYRLCGVTVFVPPLRERVEEIAPLARAFAREAAARARQPEPELAPEAIAALEGHAWPGNARELRNTIERAVLLASGRIERDHLPMEKLGTATVTATQPLLERPVALPAQQLRRDLADVERQHVIDALARCGSNQTEAAKLLGISRRTLSNRLDQLGISRPRKR